MRIVQLMTDQSRYFNPSKNYWFSFKAFLISLIDLYFRCLSFRVVPVNTARPDGAFLFVVWFIHWKRMIRPFLFIDKQKRKLSIHQFVVDFWLANVTKIRWSESFHAALMLKYCVRGIPKYMKISSACNSSICVWLWMILMLKEHQNQDLSLLNALICKDLFFLIVVKLTEEIMLN